MDDGSTLIYEGDGSSWAGQTPPIQGYTRHDQAFKKTLDSK